MVMGRENIMHWTYEIMSQKIPESEMTIWIAVDVTYSGGNHWGTG